MLEVWCGTRVESDLTKIQSSWSELIMRRGDTCLYDMCKKYASFIAVSSCLKKYRKNVYNSLTEITMCLCFCNVAESTWK